MTLWTSAEAMKITGGATGAWSVSGLSIDTRTLKKGDLFIALKGEHGDGHAYVALALEKGAAAALVDHVPDGVPAERCLVVKDTLKGLQDLGRAARERTGARVIGVTGSVGKTGTKDMLAHVFEDQCQTHAAQKSFNNHWGVPLTLAMMPAGTDVGIFELGMNHLGELSPLSKMVRPDIAIITTVEAVHVGEFENGIADIAQAKSEIFDGLQPANGIAILNHDNDWFEYLSDKAKEKDLTVYGFGRPKDADAQLLECLVAANGTRVKARILEEEITFTLSVSGEHHAMNALPVLLSAKLLGYDVRQAAKSLESWIQRDGRGKRELIGADNPVILLDESYNASPVAMGAAFKVMALIDPGRGGRRIAILGDMAELGADAPRYHKELALPLEAAGVQLVYTCGPLMKHLHDELPAKKRGGHKETPAELAEIVPDVIAPGDVVLVKGSRGGGTNPKMQVIVEALRKLPESWEK